MADASLSIDYTIDDVTNNGDGTSTVEYTLSHDGTGLTQVRTVDRFRTSELGKNVESDDDAQTKTDQVKANFERLAIAYFQGFALLVRAAQNEDYALLLDGEDDTVTGLSVWDVSNLSGTVIITP